MQFKRSEEKFIYHKNRYYHAVCFGEKAKIDKTKDKLLAYIERLLHKKIDYKINNQLKNYVQKGMSHEDIYNALYYFYEIKNNSIAKANGGIGIVPYVIDESREFFKNQKEKIQKTANVKPITENRKVTITDPTNHNKYKIRKIINISEL